MKKLWIQKAIRKNRKGSLHKMLSIKLGENIPLTLISKIIKAKAGETIRNPSKSGKRIIKVTRLMERKAILARNLKKIKRR
ncbi:MAG: hypothetical protein AABW80_01170 [Nanoarchaeota archaeon]